MKSSKWMMGLMALVLVMAFSSSSFAQVQIQLFNTPSANEIKTNHHAQTADPTSIGAGILVSGSLVATSTLTTTLLTLTFPAPITSNTSLYDGMSGGGLPNPLSIPANDPISIQGATGLFAGITAPYSVNIAAGQIVITLPGFGTATNALSGSFRIIGVRIDAVGKTAPVTASASLSSSANNYINSSAPVTLISAFGDGISAFTQTAQTGTFNNGTALVFTNTTTALPSGNDVKATFTLNEGFNQAWRTALQNSVGGTAVNNSTQILLTIAGLPAGISAALSEDYPLGVAGTAVATVSGGGVFGPGTTANTLTISFTSTSLSAVEALQYDVTFTGTPTAALTAGTVTLAATMTPNTTSGLSGGGAATATGGYPRFNVATLGPITIGNLVTANTTMLVPYAVKTGPYDTGIAIANTTADPFGTSGGGATPTAGTMTFTLYPRTATGAGTPIAITTSATKIFGAGLATDGTLVAGGTWTGLVSDILTAAGNTSDFFGYIFIQTNFLLGHGAGYIFNGSGFTSGTPVLILDSPSSVPRTATEKLNN